MLSRLYLNIPASWSSSDSLAYAEQSEPNAENPDITVEGTASDVGLDDIFGADNLSLISFSGIAKKINSKPSKQYSLKSKFIPSSKKN